MKSKTLGWGRVERIVRSDGRVYESESLEGVCV